MLDINALTKEVMDGKAVSREEALALYDCPLDELCRRADEIRVRFCGDAFDLCAITNAKSGRCTENCRFCAQAACYAAKAASYPLLPPGVIAAQAKASERQGVPRFSLVTSGKRLSEREVDKVCEAVRAVRESTGVSVCVSLGLLNEGQFAKLKAAGVTRVHNNLETSRRHFPAVCTTHTFDDKLAAIRAAQAAGMTVCSGGIMGLGETPEDRIDMALTLRGLGIKSVPVNLLNPIPGTPLERAERLTDDDMRRIVAVYRFILPDAFIRLAGGRGLLTDKGRGCFLSGANAAITGDMLTTAGITAATDRTLLQSLGYEVNCRG